MAKTAIITGASAGIGKALAMELAKRGYDLGLLARRMDALEAVAAEIHAAHGHRVEVGALDVSRDQDVGPALERLATKLGGVDVVIANAGITAVNRTGAGDFEVDKRVIRTNLLGAMATIDAAVRIFRAQGRGHVVGSPPSRRSGASRAAARTPRRRPRSRTISTPPGSSCGTRTSPSPSSIPGSSRPRSPRTWRRCPS